MGWEILSLPISFLPSPLSTRMSKELQASRTAVPYVKYERATFLLPLCGVVAIADTL